jgi:hypothetical protein
MNATALCLDDSVTTCDCCGRVNLKATVLMQLEDGALVHFGQVCAARNTGKPRQQITKEIRAERDLAHGRASNRLADLRRSGTTLTREVIRQVAAEHRADAKVLIHHFWRP